MLRYKVNPFLVELIIDRSNYPTDVLVDIFYSVYNYKGGFIRPSNFLMSKELGYEIINKMSRKFNADRREMDFLWDNHGPCLVRDLDKYDVAVVN